MAGVFIDKRLTLSRDGLIGYRLRNTSGGTVGAGSPVIFDTSVQGGDAFTTTTAQDNALVAGMLVETVTDGRYGFVAFSGHVTTLKVDGTTNIAAGDYLTTFTTAAVAAKRSAVTKPGVFAIALEAYTTDDGNGVIDAWLVPPTRLDASGNTLTYGTVGQMAADGVAASNAAGTTDAVSRVDHAHTNTANAPALTLGTSNSAGTAGSVLAADATVALFDTTAPTTIGFGDSAAAGSAAFSARRDHAHASPAASTAPIDGSSHAASNAAGTGTAVARNDHAHKAIILDDNVMAFGSDSDVGAYMPAGGVAANTAKAGVLEGTPVTQASPNGSLIIGSVTDGGDIVLAVSPSGNSLEALRVDASASQVQLGEGVLDTVIWNGTGLIVGHTAQITVSDGDGTTNLVPEVQVLGTAKADSSIVLASFNTTGDRTVSPSLNFLKSGNGTVADMSTVVASGESLGEITWFGADATDGESPAASIRAEVDGTAGTGDMPGRLVFLTTIDAGEVLTESFRVANDQNVYVGNANGMVVGNTSQLTLNALVPEFQVQGTAVGADGAAAVVLYSATAGEGPELILGRSKSGTLGTNTIVASGDLLGRILAVGADGGTGFDPAASIGFYSDGTPGALNDMPGRIVFFTSPDGSQTQTEVFRVNSSQNLAVADGNALLVGDATPRAVVGLTAEAQVLGTGAADSALLIATWSADTSPPRLVFGKSRAATIGGAATIVANADVLGEIRWGADDGVDMASTAAWLQVLVDGTPGENDLPSKMVFGTTADAGADATGRMTLRADGSIEVTEGAPKVTLGTVSGFATTQPTNALVFRVGTAPAGAITTASALFATTTVLRKIIADGTVSNVET